MRQELFWALQGIFMEWVRWTRGGKAGSRFWVILSFLRDKAVMFRDMIKDMMYDWSLSEDSIDTHMWKFLYTL